MHKFSTAATESSALPVLRSVSLLSVPYSTLAGASDPHKRVPPRLVRPALSPLRDENLCIIRASPMNTLTIVASATTSSSRSDDDTMTGPSWRRSDKEIDVVPPPPFGLMGVAGDLCVAAVPASPPLRYENLCIIRARILCQWRLSKLTIMHYSLTREAFKGI